ncbi:hypothetical protein ABKN59_006364 [Abortiporus biennis]
MSDNAPKKQTKAHLRDAVELSRRLQINIRTSSSFYTLLVPKIYSPPPHLLTAVHLNTHREKTYKNSDTLTNSIDPLGFPLKQSEPFNLRDQFGLRTLGSEIKESIDVQQKIHRDVFLHYRTRPRVN